jgi:hypothetical protein
LGCWWGWECVGRGEIGKGRGRLMCSQKAGSGRDADTGAGGRGVRSPEFSLGKKESLQHKSLKLSCGLLAVPWPRNELT